MASGGSSGRPGSGSRSFDFGSDDVLCSYDDYDASNGKRPDASSKDFHESRRGRPLVSVYGQEEDYSREDMISAVEKCMKKYADNLLRFLEGISGRLSQLEAHCYKLERGVSDLRADMSNEHSEAETKLKSLEKHIQEVHRSVQILRDKQEIAETQKELAKIQLQQKVNPTPVKLNEGTAAPFSESQKHEDHDVHHLALALPHQISASNSIPARISDQQSTVKQHDHYTPAHVATYIPHQTDIQYIQKTQVTNPPQVPSQQQTQIPISVQQQALPQYQQLWPQQQAIQIPQQQVVPSPQSATQAPLRPQNPPAYSPYPPHMSAANPIQEAFSNSGIMLGPNASYSLIHPTAGARPVPIPYNYGSSTNKNGYLGSTAIAPVMQQPNIQGYGNMYSSVEGGRTAHPPNFAPRSYAPGNALGVQSLPQLSSGVSVGAHQGMPLMSNQTYVDMIDKAVSMGYARDLVLNVIQRMSESGQLVDFNTLLDQLNARSSGAPPRAWSG